MAASTRTPAPKSKPNTKDQASPPTPKTRSIHSTCQPSRKGQPRPPAYSRKLREQIRSASMAGATDKDILAQTPRLKASTLRLWRCKDPVWMAAFTAFRNPENGGRLSKRTLELRAAREAEDNARMPKDLPPLPPTGEKQHTASTLLEALLPAISARNAIRAANEADRALQKVEKRKAPLPISTWSEYKQAYSVLRLATGQDNQNGQPAQVQVNIWGAGGIGNAGVAPAFRAVTPQPGAAERLENGDQ